MNADHYPVLRTLDLVGIPGNSHFFHVIHLKMPGMNIVFLGAC
jgi:hypothetical protein